MKLAMINEFLPALVRGDRIIDLSASLPSVMAAPPHYRMNILIERFDSLREQIICCADDPGAPVSSVRLRAPVPAPTQMLFAIGNYHEGLSNTSKPLGMFLKSPSTILDPGGTVILPPMDAKIFHHEAELAVVIGKHCKSVPAAEALNYVFGYTGIIDVSARGLGAGVGFIDKNFETFCPMGPWVTLTDEIADPQNVSVKFWQNDQLRQNYHTSDMEHKVATLIEYASNVTALRPGDVIACGTNHQGLGPMQDGETSTLEIGGVGELKVNVSDPLKRVWPMSIDANIAAAVLQWRKNGVHLDPEKAFMKRIS